MKNFGIERYKSGSVLGVILFGKFIDFRHWYQYKIENTSIVSHDIWSDVWFTHDELQDDLKNNPLLTYKKIPWWRKLSLNQDDFKLAGFFIAGLIVGTLVKNNANKKYNSGLYTSKPKGVFYGEI